MKKPSSSSRSFTSHQLLRSRLSLMSLIFVFLLSSYYLTTTTTAASRLLIPKTGDHDMLVNADGGFSNQILNSVLEKGKKEDDNQNQLMGVEEDCGTDQGDEEECLKRRMISEAHLDYIYTQHQHQHP